MLCIGPPYVINEEISALQGGVKYVTNDPFCGQLLLIHAMYFFHTWMTISSIIYEIKGFTFEILIVEKSDIPPPYFKKE